MVIITQVNERDETRAILYQSTNGFIARNIGVLRKEIIMKTQSIHILAAILLYIYPIPVSCAAAASFQGLGDLLGNEFESDAYGISSDGHVVVGASKSLESDPTEAFICTQTGQAKITRLN